MALPHAVMARLARELRDLHSTPCEGIRVSCPFHAAFTDSGALQTESLSTTALPETVASSYPRRV